MKLLCLLLCVGGVASSCDPTQSGCLDVLEHDVNVEPALEMLQMKSAKIVEADEDAEEVNVEDDEEVDLEDDDDADVEDDDEAECPDGYALKPGDIPGWGQLGSLGSIAKPKDCANRCNAKGGCQSFEYSQTSKICNLNSDKVPNRSQYSDYMFCSKGAAELAANSTDDEDESDVEFGSLDESMTWPTGPLESADKYCKRGRKTSCGSPRSWLRDELSLAGCSDKCTNSKRCKQFYYNSETKHCGICSRCDAGIASQKNQEGYSIYKKWVLEFPFKGLCKEKHSSEKGMGKARGCKKRAKKLGAVAFAYKGKTKKCRTWNKCSSNKKGNWFINKVR